MGQATRQLACEPTRHVFVHVLVLVCVCSELNKAARSPFETAADAAPLLFFFFSLLGDCNLAL